MTSPRPADTSEHPAIARSLDGMLCPSSRGVLREVAHILRSPIGAIVMLTEALRERGHQMTAEQRDEHLAIVYRAALGVSELAGDLLTLVEDGEPEVPHRTFSPRRMLDLVADVTQPVASVRKCVVSTSAPEEVVVAPDRMVARVMLGLTLRALLRTYGGQVCLSAVREGPDSFSFAVVRRGPTAVPEDGVSELTRVFRLEPETGDYTLSADGLGLAATDKLLRAMGSALLVEAPSKCTLRLSFSVATASADVRA